MVVHRRRAWRLARSSRRSSSDKPLVDPEGGFLGPSYIRLPHPAARRSAARPAPADHLELVARSPKRDARRSSATGCAPTGPGSGSTLVALRDHLLLRHLRQLPQPQVVPAVRHQDRKYDRELHLIDKALFFGHDPATILHTAARHRHRRAGAVDVYLWFLPLVPLVVTAWLIWSRNLVLRLLVRDLAVPRLDPRHHLLLRAADPRPGLRVLVRSTPTSRTPARCS